MSVIRVLLDTNTIVSGVFWQGAPRQVFQAVLEQQVKPITSEALLSELERVLHYKKFVHPMAALSVSAEEIHTTYRELAEIVIPAEITPEAVRDPQDAIVLACAVGGEADCIVSGDKDLLTLAAYKGIPIVTATQFLERLSAG